MLRDGHTKSEAKERAAHFTELFDFFSEGFLRNFEMISQAGKAEEAFRAAVDHFFRHGNFVRNERTAATEAAGRRSGIKAGSLGGYHFFTRRQR